MKSGAAAAAAQAAMSMQTMQLEWLARTGMLYHRFPELAGKKNHFRILGAILSGNLSFPVQPSHNNYMKIVRTLGEQLSTLVIILTSVR